MTHFKETCDGGKPRQQRSYRPSTTRTSPVAKSPVGWEAKQPSTENLEPPAKSHQDHWCRSVPLACQPPHRSTLSFDITHEPGQVRNPQHHHRQPALTPHHASDHLPPSFATWQQNSLTPDLHAQRLLLKVLPQFSLGSTSCLTAYKARRTQNV